ncbi:hypothetical protein [uncultured Amnibacterium sp.]|uniref:hypothetical protein n=1 Tax=uncultured Amnibacterium sp. TaxID=1631851 RepID=UPI0035CA227E
MRAHPRSFDPPLRSPLPPEEQRTSADRLLQQNRNGDVVIPLDLGEIVLLPRLWDLDLVDAGQDGVLMRSRTLAVEVVFDDGNAAVVDVHADQLGLEILP